MNAITTEGVFLTDVKTIGERWSEDGVLFVTRRGRVKHVGVNLHWQHILGHERIIKVIRDRPLRVGDIHEWEEVA